MTSHMVPLEKIYYYLICLLTFFVLMWGAIDMVNVVSNFLLATSSPFSYQGTGIVPGDESASPEGSESFERFYQRKILFERTLDSFARILVAGAIFAYSRRKLIKIEKG
ncbi:MAG: hypothetical protein ABIA63_12650 [bacterium]